MDNMLPLGRGAFPLPFSLPSVKESFVQMSCNSFFCCCCTVNGSYIVGHEKVTINKKLVKENGKDLFSLYGFHIRSYLLICTRKRLIPAHTRSYLHSYFINFHLCPQLFSFSLSWELSHHLLCLTRSPVCHHSFKRQRKFMGNNEEQGFKLSSSRATVNIRVGWSYRRANSFELQ